MGGPPGRPAGGTCGQGTPELWRVRLGPDEAPALQGRLDGHSLRLDDLLRDPADRDQALDIGPLTLFRHGERTMAPPGDLVLRTEDQLLVAGRLRARAALGTTMTEAFTASYVLDGAGALELGLAAVRPPKPQRHTVTPRGRNWSARTRRRWPGVVLAGRVAVSQASARRRGCARESQASATTSRPAPAWCAADTAGPQQHRRVAIEVRGGEERGRRVLHQSPL